MSSMVSMASDDKYRGIRQFGWAEDSQTLLFLQDDGGDENFHLFAIDAADSEATARDLTPFPGEGEVLARVCGDYGLGPCV